VPKTFPSRGLHGPAAALRPSQGAGRAVGGSQGQGASKGPLHRLHQTSQGVV